MRERRAAEQASKTSRTRMMIVAAVVSISCVGYGLWALRPRATGAQVRDAEPVRSDPAPRSSAPTTTPGARGASTATRDVADA